MRSSKVAKQLEDRISKRKAKIGVIGLGYVGLPLAMEFAREGFEVAGFDIDKGRVKDLNAGRSYVQDVPSRDVKDARRAGTFYGASLRGPRNGRCCERSRNLTEILGPEQGKRGLQQGRI